MKYYKKNNEVFAFESDGSQDFLIEDDMVRMSSEDVDKHINPEKYMTPSELYNAYLETLRPLSRRQFKLALLENNLTDVIETQINQIEDAKQKAIIQIEYTEATEFVRTSDSVKYMCSLLGLTEEQVDEMWEQALTL